MIFSIFRTRAVQITARSVKQGSKEDKVAMDGPDFIYYAHVCELQSVRASVLRPRRRGRRLCQVDISTAFLQSNKYGKDEPPKYLTFTNPITKEKLFYRQLGPIYGENSAPVRWEQTIVPWLTSEDDTTDLISGGFSFIRGDNEKCVFYHPDRDLLLLLYVDDILCDGEEEDIQWFIARLRNRFKCKDEQWLTKDNPLDHLGMVIMMDDDRIYISMENYIERMLSMLGMEKCSAATTPINGPILDHNPITEEQAKWCYSALGCCVWLSNTARPDGKYAHSRISQHIANPNVGMLQATKYLVKYYSGTRNLCLYQDLDGDNCDWEFMCDSDFAGNAEKQNKRRSQSGYLAKVGTAPVVWGSKPSSVWHDAHDIVCTASPRIIGAHADMSSGASEVYAMGNASIDLLHLGYCMEESHIGFPQVINLQVDNTTAEAFANNTVAKSKLKHIDCRQEWVKTLRDSSIFSVTHVDTKYNLADFFTKILQGPRFRELRDQFMVPKSFVQVDI